MIIKVMVKIIIKGKYFDSSSRKNIKYTLALIFFILINVNKSDIILFHGSYRVLVFSLNFSKTITLFTTWWEYKYRKKI